MISLPSFSLALLFLAPIALLAWSARRSVEAVRQASVAAATLHLLGAFGFAVTAKPTPLQNPWAADPFDFSLWFAPSALSLFLVPFASVLWLLTVTATPRGELGTNGLRRVALATLTNVSLFLTRSPVLIVCLWALSSQLLISGLGGDGRTRVRRVAAMVTGISTVSIGTGVGLLEWSHRSPSVLGSTGLLLIALAVVIRKGIFPAHFWIPEVFEHGRIGPAGLFSAPQAGAYALAVLLLPVAPESLLFAISVASLCTALYGAVLALVQEQARRAIGYLFVSQSALVLAGLDCDSVPALTGGLCLWVASGLAFAGLARCLLVLEARRGRQSLRTWNGGYERMPLLAATFLILGLACAGFPATLGFVATELLVSGAVETFPLLGFSVVASGAVTGLAILRMYFALFCGKRDSNLHLELKTSERFAFTFAAALLLGLGLVPRPMVRPASTAAAELLRRDTKTRSEAESRNSRTALGQFQPTRAGTFPAQRKPF